MIESRYVNHTVQVPRAEGRFQVGTLFGNVGLGLDGRRVETGGRLR
jgi:hypothetical protein